MENLTPGSAVREKKPYFSGQPESSFCPRHRSRTTKGVPMCPWMLGNATLAALAREHLGSFNSEFHPPLPYVLIKLVWDVAWALGLSDVPGVISMCGRSREPLCHSLLGCWNRISSAGWLVNNNTLSQLWGRGVQGQGATGLIAGFPDSLSLCLHPWSSVLKVLTPFMRAPLSWPSHFPKASPPDAITQLGWGEGGGG